MTDITESNEKSFKIKICFEKFYKLFIVIFIPIYLICIALLIATLTYYNPRRIKGTFFQIVLTIGLPITIIFRCNYFLRLFFIL